MEYPKDLEERYFHDREAELRRKAREEAEKRAEEIRDRAGLAREVGTDDAAVLDRLRRLGIGADEAPVLHLLPLVSVAWADGIVSLKERKVIMKAADAAGIEAGSPAATFLASLLETRPSAELLEEIRGLLRQIVETHGASPQSLMDLCRAVAEASGGLFNLGIGNTVDDDEARVIDEIASAVGAHAGHVIRA